MAQPQQESSLLFSLAELRQIEQDRIASEEAERQAAAEAERRAAAEAERAARQAAEQRRQRAEQAERERAEREAAERRAEALRLEEAERTARIEAEAQLAEIRLAREMEVRRIEAASKRPVGLKLLAASLVAIAVVLGLVLYFKALENRRKAEELAETRAQIADIQERIDGLIADKDRAYAAMLDAKTRADEEAAARELARIKAEIKERNAALERIRDARRPPRRPPRDTATARPPDRTRIIRKDCDPNEPLGCLD